MSVSMSDKFLKIEKMVESGQMNQEDKFPVQMMIIVQNAIKDCDKPEDFSKWSFDEILIAASGSQS